MAIELKAIIDRVTRDKWGAWKLVLEVPQTDATKVAALATQLETVFSVIFDPQESETIG